MNYREKIISTEKAVSLVQSNNFIVTGLAAAEGKDFLSHLHTIANKVQNVTITNCLSITDYEFLHGKYADSFFMESFFYSPSLRKAHANGNVSYIPNHLHLSAVKLLCNKTPDIYVGIASMPDKHGFVTVSVSNTYEKRMIESAKTVILEINPNAPRTHGETEIPLSAVDYLIESAYELPKLADTESNEKDIIIGNLIAQKIYDGDCIQLGIGGIPNAVTECLKHKNDMGVHTEMITTGIMNLAKMGVITGNRKQIDKGKITACFGLGTKELYDFMDDNVSIVLRDSHKVNSPYTIGLNDNQVSINTTIEVDITGQCCSESLGSTHFSGTGGQADTAIGAQVSKNGRSFIALYSTAMVKNPETGAKEEVSKIVCRLKSGASVSLSRNDVDYLVTEYGLIQLKGKSIRERVPLIISIAHPQFRDSLYAEAKELGII